MILICTISILILIAVGMVLWECFHMQDEENDIVHYDSKKLAELIEKIKRHKEGKDGRS